MNSIGQRIKNSRMNAKLTQEEAAEALQVSRQTISNWENEKTYPDILSVIKMSDIYNISLDHLLKEELSMPSSPDYLEYLEESTNIVKSKNKLSKIILLATYLGVWALSLIVFWFFIDGADALGFNLMFLWILLPLTSLVISFVIGINNFWGKSKWFLPLGFGIMYMLAEYGTFSAANMTSTGNLLMPNFMMLVTGALISTIGLALGSALRRTKLGRRIFFTTIVILLLLLTYQVLSIFVWGVTIGERELNKYAHKSLGLDERIECRYEMYNNRYYALNDLGFTLDYRKDTKTIYNEAFSQEENEKASSDYKALLGKMPDNLDLPSDIMVWTEISTKNYDVKSQRLYLLSVFNEENISEKDSFQKPAQVAMDVIAGLGEIYNITGIQIIYFDKNGMFEIAIPSGLLEPLTMEKLLANTKERPEDRYPEDYKKWLVDNH